MLESLLLEFPGTVLLVSHDRLFLDNVVTQTIVAEGNGHWAGYVGGYQDWLVQKAMQDSNPSDKKPNETNATTRSSATANAASNSTQVPASTPSNSSAGSKTQSTNRLASWEARELEALPAKIQALESEQAEWVEKLASPELYQTQDGALNTVQAKIEIVENELKKHYARWEALEAKR